MTIKGYEKSLVGKKFGRLTIIDASSFASNHARLASCVCECGKVAKVRVRLLITGNTKSCGCLKAEKNRSVFTKHGGSKTKLYSVWLGIKERCIVTSNKSYKNYGGRGINICDEWIDYARFEKWAFSSGYTEGLTIERIDNNLGYYPENCTWAVRYEQNNNRRNNRIVTFKGQKKTLSQWSVATGINRAPLNIV